MSGDASAASDGDITSRDGGGEPALTLAEALEASGTNTTTERASLVIDAACTKLIACGAVQPPASTCIDDTLHDWSVGALFFGDGCLDAQLDLYACYAKSECSDSSGCAQAEETRNAICSAE